MPPSPTLFSTPHLLVLENFASLPFYFRLPVYWFMCTVDSGSMKPRQSHKTVCCTCCFFHIAQNCFLIAMKHDVLEEENRAKEQVILHVDKLPLYFLCSFCLFFYKIVWWFYFNEFSKCCFCQPPCLFQPPVYCTLPVYYFGQNLPASHFTLPSPTIWNSRVENYLHSKPGEPSFWPASTNTQNKINWSTINKIEFQQLAIWYKRNAADTVFGNKTFRA